MKKVVKGSILIILFSILVVEIIKVVRLFDINGIINISKGASLQWSLPAGPGIATLCVVIVPVICCSLIVAYAYETFNL